MAGQFNFILIGMFIGGTVVWILARKKVRDLEKKLQEKEEKEKRGTNISQNTKVK